MQIDSIRKAIFVKRIIIVCWVALILCFIIKIFGGNYFEIMSNSKNYKKLCDYADTHYWLAFILQFMSSFICESLYLLAIMQKYKFSKIQLVVVIITIAISCPLKTYLPIVGSIFDLWLFIILPMIFIGKSYNKYWQILVAFALTFIFQLLSLVTKNLAIKIIDDSTFISLIFGIDVYILSILFTY